MSLASLPKVDLHVHLEGTILPARAIELAQRNNVTLPDGLIKDGEYAWDGDGTAASELVGFLGAYTAATAVLKTAQDYTDITYDYLKGVAAEGCIYAEVTISADHGAMAGLSYQQMVEAIAKGYEKAKAETGIEARFISTCVRHFGPDEALKVGKMTHDHPHPLVTGFGMAGNENAFTVADFKPAFDASGLEHRTAHAGEAAGPESVAATERILKTRRFGHMVRAIEDASLIQKLKSDNAVPEVCVSSNLTLKVYPDYAAHPLRKLFDAGLKVTLGSDDPSFFHTTIGREYQIAHEKFGFTETELLQVSRNAIEEAFLDTPTRTKLMARINAYGQPQKPPSPKL